MRIHTLIKQKLVYNKQYIMLEIVIIFILVYNKNAYLETVKMVTEESMSQAVREANVKSNNHEVQHTSTYQ